MSDIHLYSARSCPYAQRTRLVLCEKDIDFDLTEIDLRNTPEWFWSISPLGKVPLLKHAEEVIYESAVINEYLEEVFPDPPLLPRAAGARARARIWIDYANTQFVPLYYKILLEQDPGAQESIAQRLRERLGFMEQEGLGRAAGGPFWLGSELSLVDLSFWPFFERVPVLTHYRGFTLPPEFGNTHRWLDAMGERPCVRAKAQPAQFYIDAYARYADGTASGSTAREMREA